MGAKLGAVLDRPVTKEVCRHHWLIDPANGPTSRGVCKICGEVKMFDNILADLLSNKDSYEIFETDEVADIKEDIGDNG